MINIIIFLIYLNLTKAAFMQYNQSQADNYYHLGANKTMIRFAIVLSITFVLVVSLLHIGYKTDSAQNDNSVNVVTTIFPVADIIKNIGGDSVTVSHLLPPGASPHTYEPTVKEIKKIYDADIFVYIGGGLDDWAAAMTGAAYDNLIMVELTSAVQLLHTKGNNSGCGAYHGPDDPHIWLDPILIRDDVLPLITKALIQAAPEKDFYFIKQEEDYAALLTDLHEEIKERLNSLPQKKFISFHSAWQYFAKQYGLEEAAVIARFPGQEPSASWLAELVAIANDTGTDVIFCEPQLNPAIATQIANEIGGNIIIMDPLGGKDLEGRDSYINLLLYNTNTLGKALTK